MLLLGMNNNSISVTFFLEGAVRLTRSAKSVVLKPHTSKTGIGTFAYSGQTLSSHDVNAEPTVATVQRTFEPDLYLNMPSRSQLRQTGIHGRDRKKVARQWAALPVESKINAHLADLAHDFGATSFEWSYL